MIALRGDERLMILKMSSIGDVVHALPAVGALRQTWPRLHISWVIEESLEALVRRHPAVNRVIPIPSVTRGRLHERIVALREAVRRLRTERYDVVLELQGLLVSSILALATGAPLRVGRPRRREGANLLTRRVPPPRGGHAVDESLACAQYLGARPGPIRFDLAVEEDAATAIAAKLRRLQIALGTPLVVINPSASAPWKLWPPEHWATVAGILSRDAAIVIVGSPEQRIRHQQIAASCGGSIADLTGETSLAELIALLDQAALHIAGDTGSSHIAAALGRPVVGIYGSSDPIRLPPYAQSHNLLSGIDECGRRCPHWCVTAYRCLRSITPDRVVAQARRAMAAGRDPRSVAGERVREG